MFSLLNLMTEVAVSAAGVVFGVIFGAAFHAAQQVEVSIAGLYESVGRQGQFAWVDRFRQARRDQDHQLRLTFDEALAAEQVAKYGQIAQSWELVDHFTQVFRYQACDTDCLTIFQLVGGFCTAFRESRYEESIGQCRINLAIYTSDRLCQQKGG